MKRLLCLLTLTVAFCPLCRAAEAGGAVLVLFGNPGETPLDARAFREDGIAARRAADAARRAEASVEKIWEGLSQASGKIFAYVKSDSKTTEQLMEILEKDPDVLAVTPNHVLRAAWTPEDLAYHALPNRRVRVSVDWARRKIGLDGAGVADTGDAVYVAVMDTGIDDSHADLKGNIDEVWSRNFSAPTPEDEIFDKNFRDALGHGTYVSGIIGAAGSHITGFSGVNPNVRLIALKILNDEGVGARSWMLSAMDYLIWLQTGKGNYPGPVSPGIQIRAVNMSIGEWACPPYDVVEEAFRALAGVSGTLVVVAAGNEGREVGVPAETPVYDFHGAYMGPAGSYAYPASLNKDLNNMIVVGSMPYGRDDRTSVFSNWSPTYVDILAPGEDIFSTYPMEKDNGIPGIEPGYSIRWGTSAAAAYVTGTALLLAGRDPEQSAAEIKNTLLRTADGLINPTDGPIACTLENDSFRMIPKGMKGGVSEDIISKDRVSRAGFLNAGAALIATPAIDEKLEPR